MNLLLIKVSGGRKKVIKVYSLHVGPAVLVNTSVTFSIKGDRMPQRLSSYWRKNSMR